MCVILYICTMKRCCSRLWESGPCTSHWRLSRQVCGHLFPDCCIKFLLQFVHLCHNHLQLFFHFLYQGTLLLSALLKTHFIHIELKIFISLSKSVSDHLSTIAFLNRVKNLRTKTTPGGYYYQSPKISYRSVLSMKVNESSCLCQNCHKKFLQPLLVTWSAIAFISKMVDPLVLIKMLYI